ncbi:FxDxF family PEP-CTERM protein [Roseateles sp. BYS180W]|uniref:FxDxF family PEP-CTERM protein n=1 Tax=Roseateles rivi TaxID=3299028 RepID=A0ABW7FSV4_9BURK
MNALKIAAAALTLVAGVASATSYNLGTFNGPGTASFDSTVNPGGLFQDDYSFTLGQQSWVAASVTNVFFQFGLTEFNYISNFTVTLNGTPVPISTSVVGTNVLVQTAAGVTNLGAGSYVLSVAGVNNNAGTVSYGGNLAVTPVPEPESMALMLSGLVGVAYMRRRQKN